MSRPQILRTAAELRSWKTPGARVGFVPTMGALHAGHLSLVDLAAANSDQVVVSVFVNPTQFGPGEDYDRYPRDLDADLEALSGHPADAVFVPSRQEMYPDYPAPARVRVVAGRSAEILDGAARPGHFDGVCQVVAKLFNLVEPQVAVFGQKDAQQLAIIKQMVRDLNFPIEIIGAPIVREADGLALSSRNAYLSPTERRSALSLHRALEKGAAAAAGAGAGARQLRQVVAAAFAELAADPGVEPEYAALVEPQSFSLLAEATPAGTEAFRDGTNSLTLLVAAKVGDTRLIDNLELGALR